MDSTRELLVRKTFHREYSCRCHERSWYLDMDDQMSLSTIRYRTVILQVLREACFFCFYSVSLSNKSIVKTLKDILIYSSDIWTSYCFHGCGFSNFISTNKLFSIQWYKAVAFIFCNHDTNLWVMHTSLRHSRGALPRYNYFQPRNLNRMLNCHNCAAINLWKDNQNSRCCVQIKAYIPV